MASEVIVGLLSLAGTVIGTFAGILTSNKLVVYRIEQLEKKVEKHNSVVERTTVLENNVKSVWHSIDDMKHELEKKQEREDK